MELIIKTDIDIEDFCARIIDRGVVADYLYDFEGINIDSVTNEEYAKLMRALAEELNKEYSE